MRVEIISVGTELLLGNIVNTNAVYLAKKCADLGLSCYGQTTVGDNEERLEQAIRRGFENSDILILTGGLGPTKDDITKEVAAKVMEASLKLDEESKKHIIEYFKLLGRQATKNNWKQAMIPEDAIVLSNNNGTAPGVIMEKDGKFCILLPGPPEEMQVMFEAKVQSFIRTLSDETIYSQMVKICGHGESSVDEQIKDLLEMQINPTIAPYAKSSEVHLRVTAKAKSKAEAEKLMKPMLNILQERFQDAIYTMEEQVELEDVIVQLLKENNWTISTAESCTGGLLAGRLINVPGISDVYHLGHITYSEKTKIDILGVKKETIDLNGVVSEAVAREMAIGEANISGADVTVSITGLAGPEGGTEEKPKGLIYIGCSICGEVQVKRFMCPGNREKIRKSAVSNALVFLRKNIRDYLNK